MGGVASTTRCARWLGKKTKEQVRGGSHFLQRGVMGISRARSQKHEDSEGLLEILFTCLTDS